MAERQVMASDVFSLSLSLLQCYYVGALEESATGMLNEMTKPISWGVPADKVCMKLYRKDEQICELKYGE